MKTVNFDELVRMLRQWRESTIDRLGDPATREESLRLKQQLDDAIGCLELFARHGFARKWSTYACRVSTTGSKTRSAHDEPARVSPRNNATRP
jgi:hypothetical protein